MLIKAVYITMALAVGAVAWYRLRWWPWGVTAVLYTSFLTIPTAAAGAVVGLYVVNVSSSNVGGTLQILDGTGTPLSTTSYTPLPPGVGTGDEVTSFPGPAPVTLVYGKVTVDGGADRVRASLILRDASGLTLANAEAR